MQLKKNLILQIKWKIQCFTRIDVEGFVSGSLKKKYIFNTELTPGTILRLIA